ncbi:MAG: HupE/UreJ family protein [Chloroflexi bacterium]|nr:HupE/UreJ family protein [Chloroflexota bacterium]
MYLVFTILGSILVRYAAFGLVLAHSGSVGNAIEGFLHPLLGIDHLLAMITVGMLSAQMGGRAIWTVPTTFVSVMVIGGILGIAGVAVPFVEYGIASSVVILGVALLTKRRTPEGIAMLFVGLFAVFHGHAHGAELGTVSDVMQVIAYVLGFIVATAGLHVIGALLGYIALRNSRGALILRVSGACIALMGVYFVSTVGAA